MKGEQGVAPFEGCRSYYLAKKLYCFFNKHPKNDLFF
jgi:hypothetical protein